MTLDLIYPPRMASYALLACAIALPASVLGEPRPSSVHLHEEGAAGHGETATISGTGFDEKRSGPSIIHDFATHDYERGSLNTLHQDAVSDLEEIPDGDDARWYDAGGGNAAVLLSKTPGDRHQHSQGTYYGFGTNPRLGWHNAHGGRHGSEEFLGDRHLYFAVWLKQLYNAANTFMINSQEDGRNFSYSIASTEDVHLANNPEVGEYLLIGEGNDAVDARLVGVDQRDTGDWMYVEVNGYFRLSSLYGKTITGVSSGATTVVPDEVSTAGFKTTARAIVNPRMSFGRVWQTSGRDGYHSYSFADDGAHGGRVGAGRDIFHEELSRTNEWHFFEWELSLDGDRDNSVVAARINGKKLYEGSVRDVDARDWNPEYRGPTVAQLGPSRTQKFHSWFIDEVYLDNSRQRVVLADSETLDNASRYELQRIVSWSDSEIEIEFNYGEFDDGETLYLFVFNELGKPSATGLKVCSGGCGAPPEPPTPEVSQ